MKKINLIDNIWIQGFDSELQLSQWIQVSRKHIDSNDIIYNGKTSYISEVLSEKCIEYSSYCSISGGTYKKYIEYQTCDYIFDTAKESIQSICDKEYTIIYKI